ncbi:MAG: hypothetical protein JST54_35975, partial [Deltaproteobacteria bacterium]|nr:hypothetical protein [Deltaproteobacteria bacterium]
GAFRGHLVIDLTRPVELDTVARAYAKQVGLTRAETDVFVRWMRRGSRKQIASELGCDVETVRSHLKEIRVKIW